jgi:hypothetical protein
MHKKETVAQNIPRLKERLLAMDADSEEMVDSNMTRMKTVILFALVFLVATAYQPLHAEGHAPGPVTLAYNTETEVLTVSVTHVTENVNTHYVYQIVIEKNSVQYTTRSYTNQSSASGVSDTFNVSASAGDILRATAKCIVSGQGSGQLTVPGATTTSSTTTTSTTPTDGPLPTTMIVLVAVFALGVVAVLAFVMKRR